ncbi:beta-ketoacyl-[acyl-carrier-protein] synthase family protein [Frigidibacter sp. RF13]|uniref:beta-ketoacyl-[acyl-carrier-protein] synthase family protein n=1 Tax=Frigidibacter sp. RF13 TaxID=2997340 RepID=UPI00226D72DF|nr:beta-ketoacyl-[acyl-carrier-protein] synthase family protein [Frigidibacter sp. RF13]MCY1128569.1 beta-ketoacyl-[acyl-carrier-protein] synthase family protein [Frigidibacter sp. RF13]
MRRVVITGAGTVNPLGHTVSETITGLLSGRSAIGRLDIPDAGRLSVRIGAPVAGFDAARHFQPRDLTLLDRATQFALVSARQAVAASGLTTVLPGTGVIIGTAGGGHETAEAAYRAVFAEGRDRVHPFTVPRLMMNAPASRIGIEFGCKGPTFAVSSACASANHAIGLAFQLIRFGAAPAMLAGGTDAMLTFGGLKAWEGLRVLSPDGCRPFDRARNGLVMGEGAAVFFMEEREAALARGATVLAEMAGFSMGADAADMVLPSVAGAEAAMRRALADAGLSPGEIGYVKAHGTGTRANDRAEAEAIRAVFPGGVAVSSTKGAHGHLMGAAGAVELLACLAVLRGDGIAPTAGCDDPDPDCDIDLVQGAPRAVEISACLANAFAFGGLNAVLALRRG